MDEPFLPPRQSLQSMQSRHGQSSHIVQLPPEFLMPVPFCEFVCDQMYWVFCKCACLCDDD